MYCMLLCGISLYGDTRVVMWDFPVWGNQVFYMGFTCMGIPGLLRGISLYGDTGFVMWDFPVCGYRGCI